MPSMIASGLIAHQHDSSEALPENAGGDARGPYPLLLNQERQLIAEEILLRHGRTAPPFNVVDCMRLRGPLNEAALQLALNVVVERHGAFRMAPRPRNLRHDVREARLAAFERDGVFEPGLFEQMVQPPAAVRVRRKRVPSSPDAKLRAIRDVLLEEFAIPFPADGSPLVRAKLLHDDEGDRLLAVTVPHLITDALSMRIVWDEIAAVHDSSSTGMPADIPPQVRQQHDVAAWQQRLIADRSLDGAVQYWSEQWSSFGGRQMGCQDFSFVRGQGLSAAGGAGGDIMDITPDRASVIRQGARAMRATPFALFFAAICLILRRWAQRDCVTPWVMCANRQMPGADRAVGWLVNTHMIGVDLRNAATGCDVVEACRAAVLAGLRHQAMPMPLLEKRLGRRTETDDRGRIIIDWHTRPSRLALRLLQAEWVRVPGRRTQMPVGLSIKGLETSAGLSIQMVYPQGLFLPDAVRRMLGCIEKSAVSLARTPRMAVDDLVPVSEVMA